MKSPLAVRLKQLLKEMDTSASGFARSVGIDRQIVNRMQNGINPAFETLQKILTAYPSINARWLILGEAPVFLNTEDTGLLMVNESMTKYVSCRDCAEKQKTIDDLRRFNSLLQDNFDKLKGTCKKGEVA